MKSKLFVTTLLLIVAASQLYGQSIIHPWKVVDNGGGKSTSGGVTLHGSIGQPAIQASTSGGINLEAGYIPGIRQLGGTTTTLDLAVEASWNMVSVPLIVSDYAKTTLYSNASSSAFAYANGYVIRDTLQNGAGYWVKFPSGKSIQITGTSLTEDTIDVNEKWNIIGCLSYPVLISDISPVPPVTILSSFFGYSNISGYFDEDTLKPGSAYWVKVSQAGQLYMQAGSVLMQPKTSMLEAAKRKNPSKLSTLSLSDQEGINRLIFRDAKGRGRSLYFSTTRTDLNLEQYELPPLPPAGPLDVRYETHRMLEIAEVGNQKDVAILISSAVYPLTIEWAMRDQSEATLVLGSKEISMSGIGKSKIQNLKSKISLRLSPVSAVEIPKEFALYQNYPNPFNPTTRIRFDVPKDAYVAMTLYNVLGQKVAVLVDKEVRAGKHTVEFSGHNLSNGIYFYRMQSEDFSMVKKLILMK
ncbi:MAG: T9SS type A sorting domain-containing protein [Ignavibacteriae bacterium]|nr:T9SS type A sorting domain-containing protein [Ignavibacteriota bacterium]